MWLADFAVHRVEFSPSQFNLTCHHHRSITLEWPKHSVSKATGSPQLRGVPCERSCLLMASTRHQRCRLLKLPNPPKPCQRVPRTRVPVVMRKVLAMSLTLRLLHLSPEDIAGLNVRRPIRMTISLERMKGLISEKNATSHRMRDIFDFYKRRARHDTASTTQQEILAQWRAATQNTSAHQHTTTSSKPAIRRHSALQMHKFPSTITARFIAALLLACCSQPP